MTKKTILAFYLILSTIGFAKPIVSSIAANKIHNANENEQFQNPYITDGLVAMWDGEWNVGGGKHNTDSVEWINLVSGNDAITLPSTWHFEHNFLVMERSARYVVPKDCYRTAYNSQRWQIDIVVFPTMQDSNSDSSFLVATDSIGWWMRPGLFKTRNVANELAITTIPIRLSSSVRGVEDNSKQIDFFYNGEFFARQDKFNGTDVRPLLALELYANANRGYTIYVYCIRIYNRYLSDEEMKYNYSIDKARFNLK